MTRPEVAAGTLLVAAGTLLVAAGTLLVAAGTLLVAVVLEGTKGSAGQAVPSLARVADLGWRSTRRPGRSRHLGESGSLRIRS